jgi:hypothetical protein
MVLPSPVVFRCHASEDKETVRELGWDGEGRRRGEMFFDQGLAQTVLAIGRTDPAGVNLLGTGFAVGTKKIATAAHVSGTHDDGLVILVPKQVGYRIIKTPLIRK